MVLLAFNLTGAPLLIAGTSTTLPPSAAPPARGRAVDVTSELRPSLAVDPNNGVAGGLDAGAYAAVQAQVAAGDLELAWDGATGYVVAGGLEITTSGAAVPDPTGFSSAAVADRYDAAAVGTAPGAADFIVCVLCTPFGLFDPAGRHVIAENSTGANGWRISWSYNALTFEAYDGGGALVTAGPGISDYLQNLARGHLHALALRARQVGGVLEVSGWLGPAPVCAPVTGAAGMTPAAAGTLRVGATLGFDNRPLNGAIFGLGYKAGTFTDAEMRTLMGKMLKLGDIPTDGPTLDLVYRGADIAAIPATWTPAVGAGDLTRVGAPSAITGYFPPV
jgi:hypothetical protein